MIGRSGEPEEELMNEPRTYPEGVTCWVDFEQADVEAAASFYGALFSWTFIETEPGSKVRYLIAQLDGQDAAGIDQPSVMNDSAARTASWNTYIAVQDIEQAVARVEAAGGRVTESPSNAGAAGRTASCVDIGGVPFRLWQAGTRLGAQVANIPGAWNFSDLHTADPAASVAFYARLFGWVFDDLGFATMIRQPGYGDHLAATSDPGIHERQSGDSVPPGFADAFGWLVMAQDGEQPHWHVTFTVADRDDSAAAAERLGAIVLSTTDTDWTRDAEIRDPQGAVFTVSQYSPPSD
jgi:uncharacterized protein